MASFVQILNDQKEYIKVALDDFTFTLYQDFLIGSVFS